MTLRGKLRGNWFVTLPLVALTVAYVVFFDAPARRQARQLRNELEASLTQVAQGPAVLMQISQAEQQRTKIKAFVSEWQESAPQGAGSAVLLGQVSRLARNAGVHTTKLEPNKAEEHEALQAVAVTLVCTGTFEHIFRLLQDIEALPQSIWIDDLRITRKHTSGDGLQCEVKLAVFADKPEISD